MDARLARYRPRCLSSAEWGFARETVLSAVRTVGPTDAEDAKGLVSRACLFLAGPCGWGRSDAPDLGSLLTRTGIDAHLGRLAAAGRSAKTQENHRADLARLARALQALDPRRSRSPRSAGAQSPLTAAITDFAGPVAAVAAAWQRLTRRAMRRDDLEPVAGLITDFAAYAHQGGPGTLSSPAAALAAATDAVTTAWEATANTVEQNRRAPAPQRARRVSRAAAIRHAKAAITAAVEATAGPTLAEAPDPAVLDPEVLDAIAGFEPTGIPARRWGQLRPVWERLIIGYAPPRHSAVRGPASVLAAFCDWAAARPGRQDPLSPLQADELLTFGLVDAYDRHLVLNDVANASRATRRTVVRRALTALDAREPSPKIVYQPVAGPYSAEKCAQLLRLARNQPTEARRRELSFVVGLGLGAGLDGRDLRHVRRDGFADIDLGEATPGLVVSVGGRDRPRSVVVRRVYEPLVREALASHDRARRGRTAPVLGRSANRRNVTGPVVEHAVTARAGETVAIEVNRLRATWLVAAMGAVPLGVLLDAAGLRSARSITDLLPYCQAPEPAAVASALAHLQQHLPDRGPAQP